MCTEIWKSGAHFQKVESEKKLYSPVFGLYNSILLYSRDLGLYNFKMGSEISKSVPHFRKVESEKSYTVQFSVCITRTFWPFWLFLGAPGSQAKNKIVSVYNFLSFGRCCRFCYTARIWVCISFLMWDKVVELGNELILYDFLEFWPSLWFCYTVQILICITFSTLGYPLVFVIQLRHGSV